MSELFVGKVQAGLGPASHWLKLFNAAYSEKLRISVFPGSLNIALDHVFNWFDARYEAHRIWFGREEYGGERDILLLPLLERAVARARDRRTAASGRSVPVLHDTPRARFFSGTTCHIWDPDLHDR